MSQTIALPSGLHQKIDDLLGEVPPQPVLSEAQSQALYDDIKQLLKVHNATLITHYYVADVLQDLTDETGGLVADSLDMANYGTATEADTLVVLGVRFMGETAKILNPEKTVLMPTLDANCSLELGCPPDEFARFKAAYPDRTTVVYANTSAEVKAMADWVVTSSNALAIVNHLKARGEKILWAPDRHLGNWIAQETGADIVRWQGSCLVHNEFKIDEIERLKLEHPTAKVIVHPESPEEVIAVADVVGSTKVLLNTVINSDADCFIVATDAGIFHKMQQKAPGKQLICAPTDTQQIRCIACGYCPWMGMNDLSNLRDCLVNMSPEIVLDASTITGAQASIQRMLDFSRQQAII